MSIIRLILFSCLATALFTHAASGQDDGFVFYRHINQWERTNVWFISYERLTNAPKWKGQGEPPLSVSRALNIAEKHVGACTNNSCVVEISLTPFCPMTDAGIYYYNILLGGMSYVGHLRRCIILMDGSVVEPQILGSKSKHYGPASFDE